MKIVIIRAYPSFIDLKGNTYNQQEIGLATAFLSLGHEAGIVYYGGSLHSDESYRTPHGLIRIHYRKARVLLKRIALFEDLRDIKESYDLIISNEYDQIETYKTVRDFCEKTVIYHGPYYAAVNKRYNLANKIFDMVFAAGIKRKTPLIVTKSVLAKDFLEKKGFSVREAVGVGIDPAQFLENPEPLPDSIQLQEEHIHLLYVGKLEPRRNSIFLLQVLEKLIEKDSRYRLVLIGNGDPAYVQTVMDTIHQKKLDDYVIYEKRLSQRQLPGLYSRCSGFLLPTAYEIWGMVVMEALFFNCPVFTSYHGSSSVLIENGVNGYISDLDVDRWVDRIRHSDFDRSEMARYNRRMLETHCNWTNIAEKILKIYGKTEE